MKGRRQCQQNLRQVIKNDIQKNKTQKKMTASKNPPKAMKSMPCRLQSLRKAGRTEYLVRMFGNTLPAEKSIAFRTAGHCLAKHMIKTALVCQVRHGYLANFAFLPNLIFNGSISRNLAIQRTKVPKN
jgi:hypothetical protein